MSAKTQTLLDTATRLLIDRKAFLVGLTEAAQVCPARSPKPILQNVKLVADPDAGSEILATDLEIGVRVRVLGVRAEKTLSVILEPRRLRQILATTPDDEMTIEIGDEGVRVAGLRSQFSLPTEDASLYPDVPQFTAENYLVVAATDLARGIDRTLFCCDVESTRYALGGVLFEPAADTLTMVATDGRRLARQVIPSEPEGTGMTKAAQPIVSVKALKLLRKQLDPDGPPVHVAINEQTVLFRTEAGTLYARLVEGRFPKYQDVFPSMKNTTVSVGAGELRQAFEQASITTSDESRGIDCRFDGEQLKLTSQAADVGSAQVEMALTIDGPPIEITFDGRYVSQVLGALAPDLNVQIELIDAKNAAVIKTDDRYTSVLMPLTRDR